MSARFWLTGTAMAGAALLGGMSLGLYATTAPRSVVDTDIAVTDSATPSYPDYSAQLGEQGPSVIHCSGCGPTLAERQFASDMAGWSGDRDPVVREYVSDDPSASIEDDPPPYRPQIRQSAESSDDMETAARPSVEPATFAQGETSIAAVAASAGSY